MGAGFLCHVIRFPQEGQRLSFSLLDLELLLCNWFLGGMQSRRNFTSCVVPVLEPCLAPFFMMGCCFGKMMYFL